MVDYQSLVVVGNSGLVMNKNESHIGLVVVEMRATVGYYSQLGMGLVRDQWWSEMGAMWWRWLGQWEKWCFLWSTLVK